ncbi:MAG: glycoside hydrolase family 2 TIM barrel-domain containing protein [Acutalibacter sp.]|jgi:hypothetical protein
MLYSLDGKWEALFQGEVLPVKLPGTLDENGIGGRDRGEDQRLPPGEQGGPDGPIAGRFTRKHTYEGPVTFRRQVDWAPPQGRRVFFEAGRARHLRLQVDGGEVPPFEEPTISTPYVFEVTGLLQHGSTLELISDNSYPGWPHDGIVYSSAATDETQTNWNGVLGYLRLRDEAPVFLRSVRVYPGKGELTVQVEISAAEPYQGRLSLRSPALASPADQELALEAGEHQVEFAKLPVAPGAALWDEGEGNLHLLTASLSGEEEKTVRFGLRTFGEQEGRLAINGRVFFLRGEANCAEFPEEGHPPMTVEEWHQVLSTYRAYGVNVMRFHSHCPPEAAFAAADELGMMMQPELSHWDPEHAFLAQESLDYYTAELRQILRHLANHPSFVMLTLGNELWTEEEGVRRMHGLLEMARSQDPTRLYAWGSNAFYGVKGCDQESDFYTSTQFYREMIRGTSALGKDMPGRLPGFINNKYPGAGENYDSSMDSLRKEYSKPVYSFEVGQFEILPDFDELDDFQGVSDPANYRLIQQRVERRGLLPQWKRYVEATGEMSLLGYRAEVEAAMNTDQLSGISLLGLQDFPGQGTALVGMLNSHLKPKPFAFAQPQRFAAFFRDQLVLLSMPRYTYEQGETLTASVSVANYGRRELRGQLTYRLAGAEFVQEGSLTPGVCPAGQRTSLGNLEIQLPQEGKALRLDLTLDFAGVTNTYPLWVYPKVQPVCPSQVYETSRFDEKARQVLAQGGRVYLSPKADKEHMPSSIGTQFTTDFWSVGTFPAQEGSMGQLIDTEHPLFEDFPTEYYTNWQWWPMASQRAFVLPEEAQSIITEMDSYAFLRPMAQLLEARCGGGTILASSLGLQDLQQYPEARALLHSIYSYMSSDRFAPEQELEEDFFAALAP